MPTSATVPALLASELGGAQDRGGAFTAGVAGLFLVGANNAKAALAGNGDEVTATIERDSTVEDAFQHLIDGSFAWLTQNRHASPEEMIERETQSGTETSWLTG